MLGDPPLWLVIAALVSVVVLVVVFFRSRDSLSDLDRSGFPRNEPRDTSARTGPRARWRELFDPRTNHRDEDPPRD
jgi:hypothetical protein